VVSTATPVPDVGWMARGACAGAPRELFVSDSEGTDNLDPELGPVDDEDWDPSPLALAYCLPCPEQVTCLAWALARDVWGTWGRTSRHQRRQLLRIRSRRACPVCREQGVVAVGDDELCLSCGMSWRHRSASPHLT
jgi:hypothetical protein